jgi:hypothetical protein
MEASLAACPREIISNILSWTPGYAAPIREVCRAWREATTALGLSTMSLPRLGGEGKAALLEWVHARRRNGLSGMALAGIMSYAAEAGHEGIVRRCYELGKRIGDDALGYNGPMHYAAAGGHESIVRLCKEWGAADYDAAMRCAAKGGHESLARLCEEWAAAALHAGTGHHDLLRPYGQSWRR